MISPFDRIKPPIVRADQVRPFTEEQIQSLRNAARLSHNPLRDEAVILFLLDTGIRASELCSIKVRDLDLGGHRCTVLGKGNKHRMAYFGRSTKKAVWRYLQDRHVDDDEPLFLSVRGTLAGDPFTRAGILQLIARLGKAARLHGVRCSPHTFRHTAAIRFLNQGGNVFSLQQLLGHTDLTMTKRYLHLAQADLEVQARCFSPVDSLRGDRKY
jgi:integrase/recombinase XerC